MSRIDDLVAELCPRGVASRQLGEVGRFIRGNGLQKTQLTDRGLPAIHYGQLHTLYGTWTTETKSFVDPTFGARLRRAYPDDLVIVTTSEDDQGVAKATAWLGDGEVAVSSDAYIYRHSLDPRYVAYWFQTEQFQSMKKAGITGTKVRRISGEAMAKIRIPVPPLEVQRETVKILDAISELEAELKAELEAELEARRLQYAHYRDSLITPGEGALGIPLADLAGDGFFRDGDWVESKDQDPSGEVRLTQLADVGIDVFRDRSNRWMRADQAARLNCTYLQPGDVLIARMPDPLGRACQVPSEIGRAVTSVDVAILRSRRDDVHPRFVMYAINSGHVRGQILAFQTGGTRARVSRTNLGTVVIPIPPIKEQERIVETLDHFDALVNDLSGGLRAEVEARRQQYEYYRDKVLTFDEVAS